MMDIEHRPMNCCGLLEIKGMNSGGQFRPSSILRYICEECGYSERIKGTKAEKKNAGKAAFILSFAYYPEPNPFSPTWTLEECEKRTTSLQKYIEENELGELIVCPDNGNPNYANAHIIRTLVFVPNQMNMIDHAKEKKWTKPKRYQAIW